MKKKTQQIENGGTSKRSEKGKNETTPGEGGS
jgi:hypothetical protein